MQKEAYFQELVLQRSRFRAAGTITQEMLAHSRVEVMADYMADRLVAHLEAEVLEDVNLRRSIDYVVNEAPIHDSWRHQLVASLPIGSFRRRFFAYFWGIDPLYKGKRRVHELHIERRGLFPKNTMRYPDHLGPVHLPVAFEPTVYYRDAP